MTNPNYTAYMGDVYKAGQLAPYKAGQVAPYKAGQVAPFKATHPLILGARVTPIRPLF